MRFRIFPYVRINILRRMTVTRVLLLLLSKFGSTRGRERARTDPRTFTFDPSRYPIQTRKLGTISSVRAYHGGSDRQFVCEYISLR